MGLFERFLSLWIALAMALLIRGMMIPIRLAGDFGTLAGLRRQPN